MNKKTKYTLQGILIGGIVAFILNGIYQLIKMNNEEDSQEEFDWGNSLKWAGVGALSGGGAGLIAGAIVDHHNSKEKPLDTDVILNEHASSISLKKNDPKYKRVNEVALKLEDMLWDEFNCELDRRPERMGSTRKGTALNDEFDIDLGLPFQANTFRSTKEMSDEVYTFLSHLKNKRRIYDVRMQRNSFGVFMKTGSGKIVKIDVVPYKLTEGSSTQGYLSVKNKNLLGTITAFKKTNISAMNSVRFTETQKKVILLLKKWKRENDIPLNSYLLENIVKDAYYWNRTPKGLTNNVIMVAKHISTNLEYMHLTGVENTNNILTNISSDKKDRIISASKKLLEDYQYQPNSIIKSIIK